jgi:DNA replication protein DnaC
MKDSIIEQCGNLNLKAFIDNLDQIQKYSEENNWSFLKTLSNLLELELERRKQSRIELRYKQSKLYEKITIDQFDFLHHISRKKQKNIILSLTNPEFIQQRMDVILIGNPGVGKTFLAKCFGYQATQAGIKVLFTTAMDMINHLIAADADHSLLKKLNFYQLPELLIIDELGYLPLGSQGSNLFFQVISARDTKKSTIITTNLPFADWGKILDNTTVATAIADRLIANSEILILEGPSYRKKIRSKQKSK